MPDSSTYPLAEPFTRERRTPAAILGWVIDSLDANRRPRRNSDVVLRDVLAKLQRLDILEQSIAGTLPRPGDTLPVGVIEALPATDTSLRSSSEVSASVPPDLEVLRNLERVCWREIEIMQARGKTYGLAQLVDQARKVRVDMLKFKEKESARVVAKEEVEEMMRRVKDALVPYPDALHAVMEALGG